MKKRRKCFIAPEIGRRLKFINFILIFVILVSITNTFISIRLLNEVQMFLGQELWHFVFQFTFIVLGMALIVTLVYLLRYGFGATFRIERILEKIAEGDYSLRIFLRKKDFLLPMAEKLNLVLDELEKAKKK